MTESEKAQSMKSKYFVSNNFVEKIFDTMTCTYKQQMDKLAEDIRDNEKNINMLFISVNKDLPMVKKHMQLADERQKNAVIRLYEYMTTQKTLKQKKNIWKVLLNVRRTNIMNRKR